MNTEELIFLEIGLIARHRSHIYLLKYIPVCYYYSFARCTSTQGQQTKGKQCIQGFNCVS